MVAILWAFALLEDRPLAVVDRVADMISPIGTVVFSVTSIKQGSQIKQRFVIDAIIASSCPRIAN